MTLTPAQEKVIQQAIAEGRVRSVDDFIDTAIEALPRRVGGFDAARAQAAGARMRELRKGVRLDRRGQSIRDLAHIGHKY
jgi:hypothetical protein